MLTLSLDIMAKKSPPENPLATEISKDKKYWCLSKTATLKSSIENTLYVLKLLLPN